MAQSNALAAVQAAVQSALTEAQGHDAAMTEWPWWNRSKRGFQSGETERTVYSTDLSSIISQKEMRANAAGIAYMRNKLPQYIAFLHLALADLTALAEAEAGNFGGNIGEVLGPLAGAGANMTALGMLRARCQQIADALGVK